MKLFGTTFELTATDLVGYLNCRHLTDFDRAVAEAVLPKPKTWNPLLDVLRVRGAIHEQNFVDHLKTGGLDVIHLDAPEEAAIKYLLPLYGRSALTFDKLDAWLQRNTSND